MMRAKFNVLLSSIGVVLFLLACSKTNEVANKFTIPGHWLMTESQHSNKVEKALEKESMVLTFKDGKMAFSPIHTDDVVHTAKAKLVYSALSRCIVGPRPYKLENNDLVFEEVAGCDRKTTTVIQLDANRLKFSDPYNPDITRTFVRISDAKFEEIVKPSDRKL